VRLLEHAPENREIGFEVRRGKLAGGSLGKSRGERTEEEKRGENEYVTRPSTW
jgi:hypothetical protein